MSNTTNPRGDSLATPGDRMLVWDWKGRPWSQDSAPGWWTCDAPMASMTWPKLVEFAGPLYALPGVRGRA